MAWVSSTVTGQVLALLNAPQGLNACIQALAQAAGTTLAPVGLNQLSAQNVSIDLAERSTEIRYPVVNVYCEKVANELTEKFRAFSGHAVITIEVRVSQDRLEGIEDQVQMYLDAVTQVLDQNRGDWGEGMYYVGGYQAVFAAVKHGGRNFIQVAKITFDVGVSN